MLKEKVVEFINNPYDLNINLDLGYLYEKENQYASAISHYMRGAEYGLDSNSDNKKILISECLFRAAEVFNKLGSRVHSTKALLSHAISNTPTLPQLYLFLSKIHEQQGEWNECNAMCNVGLELKDSYIQFKYDIRSYQDTINELMFQKAVSNYQIGKTDKARIDLEILKRQPNLQQWIVGAIDRSLNIIGKPVLYNQIGYENISSSKGIFKGNKFISFSQCLQDVFISSIIGTNGTYLEIGSGDPFKNSNTYLLERDYNWRGISIDNDQDLVTKFNSSRVNRAIAQDARTVDYGDLDLPKDVEYLQVDCEPPHITLETLYKIPFDAHRFAIITFEHDDYRGGDTKIKSREYLKNMGYELLISDITFNCKDSFEDWWIHPDIILNYISQKELYEIRDVSEGTKCVLDIFL